MLAQKNAEGARQAQYLEDKANQKTIYLI